MQILHQEEEGTLLGAPERERLHGLDEPPLSLSRIEARSLQFGRRQRQEVLEVRNRPLQRRIEAADARGHLLDLQTVGLALLQPEVGHEELRDQIERERLTVRVAAPFEVRQRYAMELAPELVREA